MELLAQILSWLISTVFWLAGLLSIVGIGFVAYFILSGPFRRIDCANLVVELNELAVASGRTPEELFQQLGSGEVRDVPYKRKFAHLNRQMRDGNGFIESLRRFHSLLPGEIFGTMELARNERSAALLAKLSRAYLEDGVSRAQQSFKLFSSSLLFLIPTSLMIGVGILGFILPKFKDVLGDLMHYGTIDSQGPPALSEFFMRIYDSGVLVVLPVLLILFFIFLTVSHLFGLSVSHNTGLHMNQLFSSVGWLIPWRRNRVKRNFIWILGELLDNGATEAEAIRTAAAATKNSMIQSRAALALRDLEKGATLAVALRRFDRRADLAWRVENAAHGSTRFRETLEGWTSHLSALAYRQQQSAFYFFFTTITLLNGLCVLAIGTIFFLPLVTMIETMTKA